MVFGRRSKQSDAASPEPVGPARIARLPTKRCRISMRCMGLRFG